MSQSEAGSVLNVRVIPNASRDEVVGWHAGALKIKTTARPESGRANEAVCAQLAKHLGLPVRSVFVVSGGSCPTKRLRIEGLEADALRERL